MNTAVKTLVKALRELGLNVAAEQVEELAAEVERLREVNAGAFKALLAAEARAARLEELVIDTINQFSGDRVSSASRVATNLSDSLAALGPGGGA